ncbi:alpha/beta fold hydrolase [Neobacillus niacini]|uniref:alpha/beta fold hydrolase n=1 Tax=Neobacillus niacini TaxID=86668 RepID=UPI002040856D|nr:alpha/beta hydrolase [Neobacillus niacini]MCM3691391.1 alpha/beta hydrolase [Neobacillus niacini]
MENIILEWNGEKVSYFVDGDSKNPTIICLHGLAGSANYSFSELSKKLSKHYHLILIDQPGHGKSTSFKKEGDYLFSNLATWYEKVFDSILDKPFYILGHSWGADVALHYTRHYPNKIKGVILLDGGFTFPEFQEEMTFSRAYDGWNTYIDNAKYDSWEEILDEYKTFTKRWNAAIEKSVASIFTKNDKYELIASKFTVLPIIKAFFKEPFMTTYPYIKSPLLLIHATEPKELHEAREKGISQLKKDIKEATIIKIKDTGHMIQWDNPEEVSSEIMNWVNKQESKLLIP